MAALAYCFCEIAGIDITSSDGLQQVSYLARLGSWSACRSISPRASRGKTKQWGSDLYATPLTNIHNDFQHIHDTIILIDDTPKNVSSTQWHACMETNTYATQRYANAQNRHTQLLQILETGWREAFTQIVESEALDLHAMMMTSFDYFLLLQPGTIAIIHALQKLRRDTHTPFAFTIDAGPNIHLLYPPSSKQTIQNFLQNNKKYYISYIDDHVMSL
jgi:diphosphomevalonate decarboxylase